MNCNETLCLASGAVAVGAIWLLRESRASGGYTTATACSARRADTAPSLSARAATTTQPAPMESSSSSGGIDHLWADGMSTEGEEQMAKATHIPKDAHSASVQRAMDAVKPVPLVESNAKRNVGFDNIFESYRKAGDKKKKLSCEEMRTSGAALFHMSQAYENECLVGETA